ncbi:hypothetical protein [Mitsuaria sp. 7]|uniref:hypothetical protein n=1 Tax=Mitsuaria sp. 7 TaxID=1658665 RepID=UPI0012FA302F|nr:hypothetical protein [Mitsuaria sp. 7]
MQADLDVATAATAATGVDPAPATTLKRKSYLKANVATVLAIAIAATAAWITAMAFVEAYGIGASHFGQSTDLAKRAGPGVGLFVLDGVALMVVAVFARLAARAFRSGR